MHAIEAHGLTKDLGGRRVLDRVDLAVPRGSVFGFLGPNGAGKTTLMRVLLGLMRADGGRVTILGHPMPGERIPALRKVGTFVEVPALYDHLTGRANVDIARALRRLPPGETDRVLELTGVAAVAPRRVQTYSLGMRQRLALARALLGRPELLLLDEPTNGLDPDGIADMRRLIRDLPGRLGCTVFLSSHLLAEVEQTADHVALLREGRVLVQGTLQDLLRTDGEVVAEVDDPARAARVLAGAGLEARATGSDTVAVAADDGGSVPDSSAVNRLLVEAGVSVSALRSERRTLEALYERHRLPDIHFNERQAA